MQIVKVSETATEIDGKVRIDTGPRRKQAVATEEILGDEVTATHYKVGGRDALGKVIALGEEMTYLDWLGDRVFYVYKLNEGRWVFKCSAESYEEAISKASELLA